jgi:hypothetical protein
MLLHLPIAILATLSPIPVSNTVPTFDMARECRFETASKVEFDRCSRDEAVALEQLKIEWPRFVDADKNTCVGETAIGGFASYVELLTCLEMARDIVGANNNPNNPPAKFGSRFPQPGRTGVTVGEGDRH